MQTCNTIYRINVAEDGTRSIGEQVSICGIQSGGSTEQLVSVKFYDGTKQDFDADANAADFLAGIATDGFIVFTVTGDDNVTCQEIYRVVEADGAKSVGDKVTMCQPIEQEAKWVFHYGGSKAQFEADANKADFIKDAADGSVIYFYNYEADNLNCVEAYRIDIDENGAISIGDKLYPCIDVKKSYEVKIYNGSRDELLADANKDTFLADTEDNSIVVCIPKSPYITTANGDVICRHPDGISSVLKCNVNGKESFLKIWDSAYYAKLKNIDPYVEIAELPALATAEDPNTAKHNTDILMQYENTIAAHYCRDLGADLATISQLGQIYLNRKDIKDIDPTDGTNEGFDIGYWEFNPYTTVHSSSRSNVSNRFWAKSTESEYPGQLNSEFGVIPILEVDKLPDAPCTEICAVTTDADGTKNVSETLSVCTAMVSSGGSADTTELEAAISEAKKSIEANKADIDDHEQRIVALETEEDPQWCQSYSGFVEDMPQSYVDDMYEDAIVSAFTRNEIEDSGDGTITLTPEEYEEFLKLKVDVQHLSLGEIEVTVGGENATDDDLDYNIRDKVPFATYVAAYEYLINTYRCNRARITIDGEVNVSPDGSVNLSDVSAFIHHFGVFELFGKNKNTSILNALALPIVSSTSIGNLTLRTTYGLLPTGGISTGLVMINDNMRIESDGICIWCMGGSKCVVNMELELVSTKPANDPAISAVYCDASQYVSYALTRTSGAFGAIFLGSNMADFNLANSSYGWIDGMEHATGKKFELSLMSRLLAGEQMQYLPGTIDGTYDSTCVVA